MRALLACTLLACLLLSGCSGQGGKPGLTPTVAGAAPGTKAAAAPAPLRFAGGDYEGNQTGQAAFTIQEQCAFPGEDGCATGGNVDVDLTPVVPPNAQVELVVKVYGANADLLFADAYAIGTDQEGYGDYDGTATTFAPVVVRGDSGTVTLRIYNPGGFGFPPEPNPTADYEAHAAVRAGVLVPGVPATMALQPGDRLNLTSPAIEDVLLIAPDGTLSRDDAAPFEVAANGTSGDYTLLLRGGEATPVYGPNVTMTARRLVYAESEPHALASGADTTWTFPAASRPLQVGVDLRSAPTASSFTVAPTITQYHVNVKAPGNVDVLDEGEQCTPSCGFILLGSGLTYGFASKYLDEHLDVGDYVVTVGYTGNGMEAVSWLVTVG